MSRESGEEDLGVRGITPPRLLSWSCVSDLLYLKARAGYALQPSITRKPQLHSYRIQVWLYETFIASASSSSGKTSSQSLEVLYIINASIWNIFKIIQK